MEKKIIHHSWVQIEYTGSFESGEVFDTNIGKDRPLVVQIGNERSNSWFRTRNNWNNERN
jgi:FKBP-type peptidyl-prolyl cis-trans isomerase